MELPYVVIVGGAWYYCANKTEAFMTWRSEGGTMFAIAGGSMRRLAP